MGVEKTEEWAYVVLLGNTSMDEIRARYKMRENIH